MREERGGPGRPEGPKGPGRREGPAGPAGPEGQPARQADRKNRRTAWFVFSQDFPPESVLPTSCTDCPESSEPRFLPHVCRLYAPVCAALLGHSLHACVCFVVRAPLMSAVRAAMCVLCVCVCVCVDSAGAAYECVHWRTVHPAASIAPQAVRQKWWPVQVSVLSRVSFTSIYHRHIYIYIYIYLSIMYIEIYRYRYRSIDV